MSLVLNGSDRGTVKPETLATHETRPVVALGRTFMEPANFYNIIHLLLNNEICLSQICTTVSKLGQCFPYKFNRPMLADLNSCTVTVT